MIQTWKHLYVYCNYICLQIVFINYPIIVYNCTDINFIVIVIFVCVCFNDDVFSFLVLFCFFLFLFLRLLIFGSLKRCWQGGQVSWVERMFPKKYCFSGSRACVFKKNFWKAGLLKCYLEKTFSGNRPVRLLEKSAVDNEKTLIDSHRLIWITHGSTQVDIVE